MNCLYKSSILIQLKIIWIACKRQFFSFHKSIKERRDKATIPLSVFP